MSQKPEVQLWLSVLCGPERQQWINPPLAMWLAGNRKTPSWLDIQLDPMFGYVPVEHARNVLALRFLEKSRAQWLCMMDNDIAPVPELLDILDGLGPEHKIVAPICYMWSGKHHAPHLVAAEKTGDEDYYVPLTPKPSRGKNRVHAVGTGCIFIHRDVFRAMDGEDNPHGNSVVVGNGLPYFKFDQDHRTQGYQYGEDYGFCRRAVNLGFNIYADTRFVCDHYQTMDMLEVNMGWARMLQSVGAQKDKDEALQAIG